ncbi:uncharacterized protein Dana_GF20859, isoform B [Drosophila ananassae]|uniref:Uncharacterized protein, isoform B n=1 Tax=Drosophila ananassae TaxID=7217 RepID=A0A0P8ZK90_DROAN|nr:Alstrom syndrome protein 1 homolog a isoform X1 [Drosophila ananassae]KPU75217.1 uncharacterized protein Dana_GF20859, isoform B [Drosophila ananassae]
MPGHKHSRKQAQSSRIPSQARDYISEVAVDRELERYMIFSSTASSGSTNSCVLHQVPAPEAMANNSSGNCSESPTKNRTTKKGAPHPKPLAPPPPPPPPPGHSAPKKIKIRPRLKEKRISSDDEVITVIPIEMATKKAFQAVAATQTQSVSAEDLRTPTKKSPEMRTKKTQTPESALKSHKRLEWDPSADVGYYKRAVSTSNISTLERSVLESSNWRQPCSETDLTRDRGTSPMAPEKPTPPPLASSTFVNRSQRAVSAHPVPISNQSSLKSAHTSREDSNKLDSVRSSSRKENSSRHVSMPPAESRASSRRESLIPESQPSSRSSRLLDSRLSSRQESQATSLYGSSAASSFDYNNHPMPEEVMPWPAKAQQPLLEKIIQTDQQNKEKRRAEQREKEKEKEREYTAAQLEKALNKRNRNKENRQPVVSNSSTTSTAESAPKGDLDLGIELLCSLVNSRSLSETQKKKLVRDIAKKISCLDLAESRPDNQSHQTQTDNASVPVAAPLQSQDAAMNTSQRYSRRSSSISMRKSPVLYVEMVGSRPNNRNHQTQTDKVPEPLQHREMATNTSEVASRRSSSLSSVERSVPAPVPAPRKRTTALTPPLPPTANSLSSGTSTSVSHEVITQKKNSPAPQAEASTDADVADAVMAEWLHPMTQSEIEYEGRQKTGLHAERMEKLKMLDEEIRRMQLLREELATFLNDLPKLRPRTADRNEVLFVVEPVFQVADSPTPSGVDSTAPNPPPRRASLSGPPRELPQIPTSSSTVTRSTSPALEAGEAPPPPVPPHQMRCKIVTPVLRSSSSGGSESVCSFVKQRRREFNEHYQSLQKQQLLLVQQQQKELELQLKQKQQRPSQTHRGNRMARQEKSPYIQMNHYTQAHVQTQTRRDYCCPDKEEAAVYYQVVNSHEATGYRETKGGGNASSSSTTTTTTTTTTTNSSSSVMCSVLSSDMSVPMGMMNTCETTTTTTTHQYDDVACHRIHHIRRTKRKPETEDESDECMRRQMLHICPSGVAYLIEFVSKNDLREIATPPMSLQDQLYQARPDFCIKSKERKAILNKMQALRNMRRRDMEQLLMNEDMSVEAMDKKLMELPPPATYFSNLNIGQLRVFSTRNMKAMTSRRCRDLPEVVAAKNREKEEKRRRCNRLMREVFNKRLKKRVAEGQVSHNHSVTMI